jgi:alanine dehydrogenase
MQELEPAVLDRAARVFADVPAEVAAVGDLTATDLDESDLVPFAAVLSGEADRRRDDGMLVVESVGSAVMDVAAATEVYQTARERGAGSDQPL